MLTRPTNATHARLSLRKRIWQHQALFGNPFVIQMKSSSAKHLDVVAREAVTFLPEVSLSRGIECWGVKTADSVA